MKNPFFRQCLSDVCLILYSAIGKKTAILAIALHRYQPVVASAATANRNYQPITALVSCSRFTTLLETVRAITPVGPKNNHYLRDLFKTRVCLLSQKRGQVFSEELETSFARALGVNR